MARDDKGEFMKPLAGQVEYKIGFKAMEQMKHLIRHHPTLGQPGYVVDETFRRWDEENAKRPEKPTG